MTESTNNVVALRDFLRDIPASADLDDARVYPIPAELAEAIAVHLDACGVKPVDRPSRAWEPPKTGREHYLNPGKWKDTTLDNLAASSSDAISEVFANIIPPKTTEEVSNDEPR
ncbi:phage gene 29 protein family protein [Corynebacterium flavescens]|uniref:phage gene 29 protein family protein n=1 Tax=Corynebacterium flavescens TaxID=28028 RepID=UPI00289FCD9F|nr:DUF2744 domain-containing protein [Corynebacterium flavescens]